MEFIKKYWLEIIGGFLVLTWFIFDKLGKYFIGHNNRVIKALGKEADITKMLHEYKDITLADRISFYRFHNTGNDITGAPFCKFTCTNEAVRTGIKPKINEERDMFVGGAIPWLHPIIQGNSRKIVNIKKELYDEYQKADSNNRDELIISTYEYLKDREVHSVIAIPVKKGHKVMGYISANYCREVIWEDLNKQNPESISKYNQFKEACNNMEKLAGAIEWRLK